jgi:hypothetical protein
MKHKQVLTLAAALFAAAWLPIICPAQVVNTGSTGIDGALDFSAITYTTNIVINMADHPTGIYQYTTVNIPTNVTVTFMPNANNSPVTWLLQGSCIISGTVDVSGQSDNGLVPGQGGPGGGAGGYGGQGTSWLAHKGAGLGGGDAAQYNLNSIGGGGSYATVGRSYQAAAGLTYGNMFLLPLLGGSGGGGGFGFGGGGGGGAILIASDSSILVNGAVTAYGGYGYGNGGGGSGGAVRLVAPQISGHGGIAASGLGGIANGGSGFVRLDVLDDEFVGTLNDSASRGFNPILVAPAQAATLAIQSIAGNAVPANPTGVVFTPDATISAQQNNPIPVVVSCVNLPLNTPITVVVKPVNGPTVTGSTANTTGTQAASTATVSMVMPRGGGLVYATAATAQ